MFGYVVAPVGALSEEDEARYKAAYCGLCRSLGEHHGQLARFSLTYDMTFLAVLLESLYEPDRREGKAACLPHPVAKRAWQRSTATDYAADMTIALTWHKCMDDWQDDKALHARAYAAVLRRDYDRVAKAWPRQCGAIENEMRVYNALEQEKAPGGELCASFGRLMGELFVWREDVWSTLLRAMGNYLGQFICLMDAAMDYDHDRKHGSYNALETMGLTPPEARDVLTVPIGRATALFEKLPLEKDLQLLRSILYAGVWQQYEAAMKKKDEDPRQAAGEIGGDAR